MAEGSRIEVPGAGLAVDALLVRPRAARALVVFGHGAGAGIGHPLLEAMAEALAGEGLATLRFQFPFMQRQIDARGGNRGFGRDPLPVALATIDAAVASAVAERRRLRRRPPLLLGGHSYGARMASHAAVTGLSEPVAGLLLLSFPLHPSKRPAMDKGAHLPQLSLPTLLVSGARDAMAQAPVLEDLVARMPRGGLVRVPGADHGWQTAKRFDGDPPMAVMARAARAWCDRL